MSRETKQYIMLVILNCNYLHMKDIVKEIFETVNFVSFLIVWSDFSFITDILSTPLAFVLFSFLCCLGAQVRLFCNCSILILVFSNMSDKTLHVICFTPISTLYPDINTSPSFLARSYPEYLSIVCATSQWLLIVILWWTNIPSSFSSFVTSNLSQEFLLPCVWACTLFYLISFCFCYCRVTCSPLVWNTVFLCTNSLSQT